MITVEGFTLLLNLAAGVVDDPMTGWKIVVSDGAAEAEAAVAPPVVDNTDDGAQVTLTATFGEGEANMEWAIRRVVSGQGVVVDEEVEDQGRKAAGSEWDAEVTLELGPSAE